MQRLPTFIAAVTADHAGPDDPYWHDYLGLALGFIHRVVQLEAEGQHPVIRVSWQPGRRGPQAPEPSLTTPWVCVDIDMRFNYICKYVLI